MISDEKIASWCEMLAAQDSLVEFPLGVEKGAVWQTKPPYPDLSALDVSEVQVRRLVLQTVSLAARMEETDEEGQIEVTRLVAELEGGAEIELSKTARPLSSNELCEMDNVCRACELPIIDESEVVMFEGRPYHRRCME